MDRDVGLRRPRDLAPEPEPGSDPVLLARIRAEIERDGPMTFARFMELALYDPERGYYMGSHPRPGRGGDFLTAPEAHPIFGWALARQALEVWELLEQPRRFVVREHGSGTGALILGLLDALARDRSPMLPALRYQPVEIEPRRVDELRQRLAAAGYGDVLDPQTAASEPVTGLILANEVIDALPVHRVRGTEAGIEELYVAVEDGALREVAGPPSTPALAARLAGESISLRPGQVGEVNLALDAWVAARALELARGLLLIVDYGYPGVELYDPVRRPRGTLLGYWRHRPVDDPFRNVGRQDLTAHVDITAVERAANAARLATLGITTQAEMLAGLGAGELLAELRDRSDASPADYLAARAALVRMVDPAAMGRFRVLGFGRGLPASGSLRGLTFRLRH
jgi:SAM-dependent MidA family methyltransferase